MILRTGPDTFSLYHLKYLRHNTRHSRLRNLLDNVKLLTLHLPRYFLLLFAIFRLFYL